MRVLWNGIEYWEQPQKDDYYILTVTSNLGSDSRIAVKRSAVIAFGETYRPGQQFFLERQVDKRKKYILANVGPNLVAFINLVDGTMWSGPVQVSNVNAITDKELDNLAVHYEAI